LVEQDKLQASLYRIGIGAKELNTGKRKQAVKEKASRSKTVTA